MMRSDLITTSGPQPVQLRFSVDEYYKMYELGLIKDFERVEIIDGELIRKMGIGDRHASVVDRLNRYLVRHFDENVLVRIQNPLRLNDYDEPEPDVVLADLTKYDGRRHPRPEETILVIEVADASLGNDRNVKLPLYADAGIAEAWIINLRQNVVEIHQNPNFGMYQHVKVFNSGQRIESAVLPQIDLEVDSIIS